MKRTKEYLLDIIDNILTDIDDGTLDGDADLVNDLEIIKEWIERQKD